MRALKGLVIFLGILILAGLTIIAIEIFDRYGNSSDVRQSVGKKTNVFEEVRRFGKKKIIIPKGTKILETNISEHTIVLRLNLLDGNYGLLVIDKNKGEQIGLIILEKEN